MVDRWCHAPVARTRLLLPADRARGLAQVYRGRAVQSISDIYDNDHVEARGEGRFRWIVSTCLAAAVGAIAIVVVVYGSLDSSEGQDGLLPTFKRIRDSGLPSLTQAPKPAEGLAWTSPRSDRMKNAGGAMSTRYIVHESSKKRRNGRDYIDSKPYARIVARLAPVPPNLADSIPPFNPFRLYANTAPVGSDEQTTTGTEQRTDVALRVVELLGGILPGEDGQELDNQEVADIVARVQESDSEPAAIRPGFRPDGAEVARDDIPARVKAADAVPPNTRVLHKSVVEGEEPGEDLEGSEVRVVKAARGDTLVRILTKSGGEPWQARAMVEAARTIFADTALTPGMEVHVTLVPSLTQQGRMDPSRFSVFSDGHDHKVTVSRNAAGEFVASASPMSLPMPAAAMADNDQPQASSLYASLYYAGLTQNLSPDTLMQIMRIHAYETDFRRRLRSGDSVEFFFDLKDDSPTDGQPGELLFTAIATGGETSRFYRFRTPDAIVDYYDEFGNNSKKFLMRRPVRGDDVRLASGFGIRFHPLLNERRMHTGVDWATAQGTPIFAAGTGVIEESAHKGQYGNYIRIRHANGYQTAYGHMRNPANGVRPGVKVRQGQVIGYVGSTGLSSGPHLHFEVLVNNRFVDPLQIQVPRERRLTGRQLADFQKERARIDDLMRRAPVSMVSK